MSSPTTNPVGASDVTKVVIIYDNSRIVREIYVEKTPFLKSGFAMSKRFLFLAWQGLIN